jgi:hypothetical protein
MSLQACRILAVAFRLTIGSVSADAMPGYSHCCAARLQGIPSLIPHASGAVQHGTFVASPVSQHFPQTIEGVPCCCDPHATVTPQLQARAQFRTASSGLPKSLG